MCLLVLNFWLLSRMDGGRLKMLQSIFLVDSWNVQQLDVGTNRKCTPYAKVRFSKNKVSFVKKFATCHLVNGLR